jgi:hypothetical protein
MDESVELALFYALPFSESVKRSPSPARVFFTFQGQAGTARANKFVEIPPWEYTRREKQPV